MPAKQTIVKITKTRTKRNSNKNGSGKKRGGNQKRCPGCGRYM